MVYIFLKIIYLLFKLYTKKNPFLGILEQDKHQSML